LLEIAQKTRKWKKSLVIDAGIGFTRASEVPWIFLKPRIDIGKTSGKTMKNADLQGVVTILWFYKNFLESRCVNVY
jgi:hypothetical protein